MNLLLLLKAHRSKIILATLCFSYFFYFSFFTLSRYYNFYPMRYDLGNMVQTVWNTSQGDIFVMTHPETSQNISRFSVHGDFFLIFLAPIYKIFPYPQTLLIVQVLLITLSGVVLYLLSQKLLNNNLISLLLVFAFFLNPSLEKTNIYEFHAVTVVPLFIFLSFYFMVVKKYVWFFLFFFLACSTKEQISLVYIWFGFFILLRQKNIKIGLLAIALSLSWFFLMISVIIPHYREGLAHFGLKFYTDLGDSPFSIFKNIFAHPLKIIQIIISPTRLKYLNQIFLPLGFLPLLTPIILFTFSELSINLLSNYQPMLTISYQYTAVITPLLFIALIYFFIFIKNKFPKLIPFFAIYLLAFTLTGSYLYGPLFFSKRPNNDVFTQKFTQIIPLDKINSLIPPSASLSVTNNLGAHFANHKYLYAFPAKYNTTDYALIFLEDSFETIKTDKMLIYIDELNKSPNYKLIFQDKKLFLFKKI